MSRLYRQKTQVFVSGGVRGRRWTGRIKMSVHCGVRSGEGEFLFTGTVRFGEAWMGCAPRYKDFLRLYQEAQQQGTNPCHVDTDWQGYFWVSLKNRTSPRWVMTRAEPEWSWEEMLSDFSLNCCSVSVWRQWLSSWTLPSSLLTRLCSQSRTWCSVECVGLLLYSQTRRFLGF